ncbi:hypothetical protein SGRA_p0030 (plasmid) [Saprospira grandis str. Lewin]|uniref:Uncharacterized protein n=1 Tax=Saprospira grandis (strain Lewin) TaxID=984262 RepID=H6LB05_SAPGL|nr:hypothetical protein SGRA_p0030 [Saprospira grandis str. Lewin]
MEMALGLAMCSSGRQARPSQLAGDNKAESRSSMTKGNNGRADLRAAERQQGL